MRSLYHEIYHEIGAGLPGNGRVHADLIPADRLRRRSQRLIRHRRVPPHHPLRARSRRRAAKTRWAKRSTWGAVRL